MSEVTISVYDLSKGMAKGLSAQFLGPQFEIEAIPHTGIVAYGESALVPHPQHTDACFCFLGREYYFGGGIQDEDPHQFRRNTGMMPFQTIRLGTTNIPKAQFDAWCRSNTTYTPTSYDLLTRNCNNFCFDALQYLGFPASAFPNWILDVPRTFLSSPMGQMIRPMLENMQVTAAPTGGGSAAPQPNTLMATNPWAATNDNPWSSNTHSSPPTPGPTAPKSDSTLAPPPKLKRILNMYTSALVSKETKAIPMCLKKLSSLSNVASAITSPNCSPDEALAIDDAIVTILESSDAKSVLTYAFFLLRLTVLRGPSPKSIGWIQSNISLLSDHNHQALAWLVLSHVAVSSNNTDSVSDRTIEHALEASNSDPAAVQQAATAFLYNTVIHTLVPSLLEENQVDDTITTLVCTWCSAIPPTDAVACERQLAAMGRLVQSSEMVRDLVRNLEWTETVNEGGLPEGEKCRQLVEEIKALLLNY